MMDHDFGKPIYFPTTQEVEKMNKNQKTSFEVKSGDNLCQVLKHFPGATVRALVSHPGEDVWRVEVDPVMDQVTGPVRVVCVVEDGHVAYGTTPAQAKDNYGITPDIMFIRNDGWTLGCREEDRDPTFKLWEGDWIGSVDLRTKVVTPIVNVGQVPGTKSAQAEEEPATVKVGKPADKVEVFIARVQITPTRRVWMLWDMKGNEHRSSNSKAVAVEEFFQGEEVTYDREGAVVTDVRKGQILTTNGVASYRAHQH